VERDIEFLNQVFKVLIVANYAFYRDIQFIETVAYQQVTKAVMLFGYQYTNVTLLPGIKPDLCFSRQRAI
jgi:hypothetical protein